MRIFVYKIILAIIIVLFSLEAISQNSLYHKIDLGSHSAYFFDEKGFQFVTYPLGPIRTISYSRSKNDFKSGIQFRYCAFNSLSRESEYILNKRYFESYYESYGYFSILYLKKIRNYRNISSYFISGLTHRSASEAIICDSDGHSDYIDLLDFAIAGGFKMEINVSKRFYIYFQPLFNYYFIRYKLTDAYPYKIEIPQSEIILNAGLGYYFNTQRKNKK